MRERVGPAKAKARERETGNETIPYHLERSIISIFGRKKPGFWSSEQCVFGAIEWQMHLG